MPTLKNNGKTRGQGDCKWPGLGRKRQWTLLLKL